MSKFRSLLAALLLLPLLASAQQVPTPPTLAARSWLLIESASGQVLASQATDERLEPASLTKLMTAYLVFDALRAKKITLEQRLPVSERAWKMPGSRRFP